MATPKKTETVPKGMEEKFSQITALTDAFAAEHLNDEYAQLMRYLSAALARKKPSPLAKGYPKTWACGVAHAIGMVNFLFAPSQTPHISATELYQWFGVSNSAGQAKSKQIRDLFKMHQLDPDWTIPSRVDENPLTWMLSVNGFVMDIRSAPLDAQITAYQQGLIPYVPVFKTMEEQGQGELVQQLLAKISGSPTSQKTGKGKQKSSKPPRTPISNGKQALFTFEVLLIDGPITPAFMDANPQVSRTVEMTGQQTLEDLHQILFRAFDREEEHLYEFQIGGVGPDDPNADRYCKKIGMGADADAGDVATTSIASLGFSEGDFFGYWFDFGDSWWHQIEVTAIAPKAPKGNYPKITQRVGQSPPQYADFDAE